MNIDPNKTRTLLYGKHYAKIEFINGQYVFHAFFDFSNTDGDSEELIKFNQMAEKWARKEAEMMNIEIANMPMMKKRVKPLFLF